MVKLSGKNGEWKKEAHGSALQILLLRNREKQFPNLKAEPELNFLVFADFLRKEV